ncbi:MAG TPA: threonine/serine dehydratase [Bryobacteraceae bacterium]|nr:threonine/serine dehydratase [Bryobacteraceae bacterium]
MRSAIAAAYDRIRPWVRETPLEECDSAASGVSVFLKLEHLQRTGSFKFRGASNKIAGLTPEQAAAGVIAASNGNHGLGVAAAAQMRGIAAEVFVSSQVSPAKAQRIESHGARIRQVGNDPLSAEVAARRAAEQAGKVFISPYNDLEVIAGQGTIAVELEQQLPRIDAVFVAVGGGGLIGGIGAYLKAASPRTEVVGCWPENSPVLLECLRAGSVVDVAEQPTLSESTSGGLEPGSVTLDVCREVIDRSVMVSEDEILRAMRLILKTEHWVVEGAAGVAVAAFRKDASRYAGRNVVIVLCGRNVSPEVLERLAGK